MYCQKKFSEILIGEAKKLKLSLLFPHLNLMLAGHIHQWILNFFWMSTLDISPSDTIFDGH